MWCNAEYILYLLCICWKIHLLKKIFFNDIVCILHGLKYSYTHKKAVSQIQVSQAKNGTREICSNEEDHATWWLCWLCSQPVGGAMQEVSESVDVFQPIKLQLPLDRGAVSEIRPTKRNDPTQSGTFKAKSFFVLFLSKIQQNGRRLNCDLKVSASTESQMFVQRVNVRNS